MSVHHASQSVIETDGERVESVSNHRVIWQSDTAKTYQCPTCLRPVFTQYEGDRPAARIECTLNAHAVTWPRNE